MPLTLADLSFRHCEALYSRVDRHSRLSVARVGREHGTDTRMADLRQRLTEGCANRGRP